MLYIFTGIAYLYSRTLRSKFLWRYIVPDIPPTSWPIPAFTCNSFYFPPYFPEPAQSLPSPAFFLFPFSSLHNTAVTTSVLLLFSLSFFAKTLIERHSPPPPPPHRPVFSEQMRYWRGNWVPCNQCACHPVINWRSFKVNCLYDSRLRMMRVHFLIAYWGERTPINWQVQWEQLPEFM